jgi:hypothetical protein
LKRYDAFRFAIHPGIPIAFAFQMQC